MAGGTSKSIVNSIEELEEAQGNGAIETNGKKKEPEVVDLGKLFGADLEPKRHDFECHGIGCYIVLQPMSGYKFSEYQTKGHKFSVNMEERTVDTREMEYNKAESEIHLVLGTVTDFLLPQKGKDKATGEANYIATRRSPVSEAFNKKILQSLPVKAWDWLVEECGKVNGLGPFPEDSGD